MNILTYSCKRLSTSLTTKSSPNLFIIEMNDESNSPPR